MPSGVSAETPDAIAKARLSELADRVYHHHERVTLTVHRVGKQVVPPLDGKFSARRGTHRIIYRIDDKVHVG